MTELVVRDAAAVAYVREEAARILKDWVPGMRIWAPAAGVLLEAALAEDAGDVLGKRVVLQKMYSNREGSKGEYAGHDVLIVDEEEGE